MTQIVVPLYNYIQLLFMSTPGLGLTGMMILQED
jgi:multisubunit Na+/H+ antiporter MnhB subunit